MLVRKLKNYLKKIVLQKRLRRLSYLGVKTDITYGTIIHYQERVKIGSYVYIGPRAEINGLGGVEIGNGVICGPNLVIHSANHKWKNSRYIPYDEEFEFRKVVIEDNVWVGGNVIITPGSYIGEGCIIGAGTVVSGKIPPLSIVVGNPCRVIKNRDKEHYEKLKEEGAIYLKNKIEKGIQPLINKGYHD